MLKQATERLSAAIDELLALLAVHAGVGPDRSPVDLRATLLAAAEAIDGDMVALDAGPWPRVLADPEHARLALASVLDDLLEGGGSVRADADADGDLLVLALAHEANPEAGFPHRRGRTGSYLARRLVEANAGWLADETAGDERRTVRLALPLEVTLPGARAAHHDRRPRSQPARG